MCLHSTSSGVDLPSSLSKTVFIPTLNVPSHRTLWHLCPPFHQGIRHLSARQTQLAAEQIPQPHIPASMATPWPHTSQTFRKSSSIPSLHWQMKWHLPMGSLTSMVHAGSSYGELSSRNVSHMHVWHWTTICIIAITFIFNTLLMYSTEAQLRKSIEQVVSTTACIIEITYWLLLTRYSVCLQPSNLNQWNTLRNMHFSTSDLLVTIWQITMPKWKPCQPNHKPTAAAIFFPPQAQCNGNYLL